MVRLEFNNLRNERIIILEGRRKGPFAPLTRNIVKYNGGHRLRKTERGLLEITQPIGFKAANDDVALQIKDEISSWLVTEEIAPLKFDDEPGRSYWCVVDGTLDDLARKGRTNIWHGTIKFLCFYTSGRSLDINVLSNYADYQVSGQTKTQWKSRTVFTNPTPSFTLENDLGGKVICQFSFKSNDVLEIDYRKRKVKLNGEVRQSILLIQSNWFALKPGINRLRANVPTIITYEELFN